MDFGFLHITLVPNSNTSKSTTDDFRRTSRNKTQSECVNNWSSWTGFPLTLEQIDNSFADLEIEKVVDTRPTSDNRNEDVDEVIEYIYVIGKSKNDSPINLIEKNDLNTIKIGINDDFSVNFDLRSVNPHFSHDVKCINFCEQQPSPDMVPSINYKGEIEVDLALEGLRGITTALDRQA